MHALAALVASLLAIFSFVSADAGEWLRALVCGAAFFLALHELRQYGES